MEKTCDYFVKKIFRPFAHKLAAVPSETEQGGTELIPEKQS